MSSRSCRGDASSVGRKDLTMLSRGGWPSIDENPAGQYHFSPPSLKMQSCAPCAQSTIVTKSDTPRSVSFVIFRASFQRVVKSSSLPVLYQIIRNNQQLPFLTIKNVQMQPNASGRLREELIFFFTIYVARRHHHDVARPQGTRLLWEKVLQVQVCPTRSWK